jgi:hypothetical protein
MSMKNSSDTIGNRTHDLPACSTLPHPTAPLATVISILKICQVKLLIFVVPLQIFCVMVKGKDEVYLITGQKGPEGE